MHQQRPRLVVVDTDRTNLTLIGAIAATEEFDVASSGDPVQVFVEIHKRPAELVLVDVGVAGVAGLEVVQAVHQVSSRTKVVLMAETGSREHAVEAIKLGAADYLTKPLDAERLRQLLRDVRGEAEQRRSVLDLEYDLAQRLEFCGMIGRSPAMQEVFALIRRLAPHAATVSISGEAGTGKELAARALHRLGPRRNERFLSIANRDAVDALLDGNTSGTVFVDEVMDVPPALQGRLARAGDRVRLIAATRYDLRDEAAAGRLDSDLLAALDDVEVRLPPLRDRREDIPYLTAAFLHACSCRFGKTLSGLTPGAERMLAAAAWPGNVRQLRQVLERASILAHGELIVESDLAPAMRDQDVTHVPAVHVIEPGTDGTGPVACDREQLVRTLQHVRGNKAVAARLLGISRRAFYRQLERHGLHQPVAATRTAASTACDREPV